MGGKRGSRESVLGVYGRGSLDIYNQNLLLSQVKYIVKNKEGKLVACVFVNRAKRNDGTALFLQIFSKKKNLRIFIKNS